MSLLVPSHPDFIGHRELHMHARCVNGSGFWGGSCGRDTGEQIAAAMLRNGFQLVTELKEAMLANGEMRRSL